MAYRVHPNRTWPGTFLVVGGCGPDASFSRGPTMLSRGSRPASVPAHHSQGPALPDPGLGLGLGLGGPWEWGALAMADRNRNGGPGNGGPREWRTLGVADRNPGLSLSGTQNSTVHTQRSKRTDVRVCRHASQNGSVRNVHRRSIGRFRSYRLRLSEFIGRQSSRRTVKVDSA